MADLNFGTNEEKRCCQTEQFSVLQQVAADRSRFQEYAWERLPGAGLFHSNKIRSL